MRTHRTLFALYLLFFGEVFRIEGAGRIQDSEDHDTDIGEDGRPHVGDTQSTQQQAGCLDGQSKDDVLVDDALGAAGNAHGEGDLGRVVIHQDDVGGLNGGVRAQSTHGDAHIHTGEDRGVVDAVAHEGQHLFGFLGGQELLDLVHLIAGQQAGVVLVDAQLCRDSLCHRLCVAGKHDGLADAGLLECP